MDLKAALFIYLIRIRLVSQLFETSSEGRNVFS